MGNSLLKKITVFLYGFGSVIAALMALAFISANIRLISKFGLLEVAYTFLPMLLLMIGVLQSQRASPHVIWVLVPVVLVSATLLLFAMVNHGFPDRALLFAVPHLAIVLPIGIVLLLRRPKSQYPPSNRTIDTDRFPAGSQPPANGRSS